MDMLLHNPISEMYGPDFLKLYGLVIAITLVVCWRLMQDSTAKQPLPLIPAEPDPHAIAYLRGGETEVMKLTVFDLIQRGYLEVRERSLSQVANHPNLNDLTPVEREIFDRFSSSRPVTEITSSSFLPASIKQNWAVYQQQLQAERLLHGKERKSWNSTVGSLGIAIIFSLGIYKLLIALGKGHYNVGYLITMGAISITILFWWIDQTLPRLSHRGQGYLHRLKEAFEQLKQKAKTGVASASDYNLLVALFSVEVLAGTSYDFYRKAFLPPAIKVASTASSRSSNDQRSSCESSCSSSSGGSSCGGGGCGGCGGGCGGCGG